ncbi:MAG: siderophore-interacting protein [Nocardioides sp.]
MSGRTGQYTARVRARHQLSQHLVRLTLAGEVTERLSTTGLPDEWVGLVIPGQVHSRYYTVREWRGKELVIDIVLHPTGLVTEWASGDCVGQTVSITEPRGSFAAPADATWLILVGDLTALPAMARIAESTTLPTRIWAEVPEELDDYLPASAEVTWLRQRAEQSVLSDVVAAMTWPAGVGYFWMAGESAQMRAIRKQLMRERRGTAYDVMGYWRRAAARSPRATDPGPIWRAGKAAGRTDQEIWAAYDRARESQDPESPERESQVPENWAPENWARGNQR